MSAKIWQATRVYDMNVGLARPYEYVVLLDDYSAAQQRIAQLEAELAKAYEHNDYNAQERRKLEAALREIADFAEQFIGDDEDGDERMYKVHQIADNTIPYTVETKSEPRCGPGPITMEPQDYKVQCICGWTGQVSTLKSLPGFKMGCPDCSQEFVPIDKMTFPVKTEGKPDV